jgi:hypothetical protein
MAVKLNELEATGTRWNAPSEDYPQGSFINGTGQGKRDGSYAKAEWANDLFGAHAAILKNGGETPNGKVETANNSQVFNALKKIIKTDIDTLGGDPSAVASGTVNAITATFTKPVSLEGGKQVKVRALGANTSATVTFNPNNLGAKPIVKGDGSALSVGDIASAGFWMTLIYDATLRKWILQNPATGVTLVLPKASTSTKGIIQIASSAEIKNGTDVPKAITPKQLKDATKDLGGGLPLGHLFAWPFQTPPDGCIQCNGSTYSRVLYKDFWNYISSKGWVKTEGEWNSIASANGGYCSYYSTGDGSTTFRTPKFAPFTQVAIASGDVGKYHKAGLPNITGRSDLGGIYSHAAFSGAIATEKDAGNATGATHVAAGGDQRVKLTFDASNSNSIYGRSSTVQPESPEWMICVVVMGMATNIGSADVADVMQAVAQVQSQVNTTVKTINNQKPNSSGNISISTAIGFPSYTSYVTIAPGDYTPSDNGWIRMDLATSGDYQSISCIHKASGQRILYYLQARYPGDGVFMCPVCKNETYTLSGPQGRIWFHRCRG